MRVELVNYKEFAAATLNPKEKVFVIYVVLLKIQDIVYLSHKAQSALRIANKAPVKVLKKYIEYVDKFPKKAITKLLEYTRINDHLTNLEKGKQPSYRPIYSLGLVKLKILKIYIKDNLKNSFIRPLKSSIGLPILFGKKAYGSL